MSYPSATCVLFNNLILAGLGPEFVTDKTYQLANGLNRSTNYSFYVRVYSKAASDSSKEVSCETGKV